MHTSTSLDFSPFWAFFLPFDLCCFIYNGFNTHGNKQSCCFFPTENHSGLSSFPGTLSDLFVKHRHFKQWWCERYFMCFKSLIWSINIFPCQACWLCYSPNTGMLNIWLLYVLVIVSPFLWQGSMPKNNNWKFGVVVNLLLSQLLLHFCYWVCKIEVLQKDHSAERSWNISGDTSSKKYLNTSIFWFEISAKYGTNPTPFVTYLLPSALPTCLSRRQSQRAQSCQLSSDLRTWGGGEISKRGSWNPWVSPEDQTNQLNSYNWVTEVHGWKYQGHL